MEARQAEGDDSHLFTGGPPLRAQFRIGLAHPRELHVARRAVLFMLVTWLPLLLFSLAEGSLVGRAGAFVWDFGVLARLLVAGPLLLVAESLCSRVLSDIATRLWHVCLPGADNRRRFEHAVESTLRLRDALVAEFGVAVLAYALAVGVMNVLPMASLPQWHRAEGSALSLAGWWYAVVSLPLLLMLLFGWLWRLFLWARFLLLVGRLELLLVPVHPDRAAGLGFVGYSLRGFALVGGAVGAIMAGSVANQVVHGGRGLSDFAHAIGGLVAVIVVLFTLPLLSFSLQLVRAWRRGVRDYGSLATAFGVAFEREWFSRQQNLPEDVLERGDFSAATDLYQVVERVQAIRIIPVDVVSVALLAIATLLPFVPVVLIALPFDVILRALEGFVR